MATKKKLKGPAGKQAPAGKKTGEKKKSPARSAPTVKAKKAAEKQRPKAPSPKAVSKGPKKQPLVKLESPADRTAALRKELLGQRSRILGEAKREIAKIISGEGRQIVETALDDGDWSVVDLSEDISLKQLSTHRENLAKIDEALRKLNEGTYGICEECGEEIDIERLRVMPFAIYCKEDQERKEIMEAMEREGSL